MSYRNNSTIVIDIGSGQCRAGFSGNQAPSVIVPSIVGIPRRQSLLPGCPVNKLFIGEEAQLKRGILTLYHPIEFGEIKLWDYMEAIFDHIFFKKLKVDPKEHSLLIITSITNNLIDMKKLFQIMFERFSIPAMCMHTAPAMALFSYDLTTGIVCDCGDGATQVVTIYKKQVLKYNSVKTDIAGSAITDFLADILVKRHCIFRTTFEKEIIRDIKEKLCYIAPDFDQEILTSSVERNYELPDGQVITIGNERFRCTEIFFQPGMIGREVAGLDRLIYESVMKCDIDIRKELFQNILLSGGSTMIPGFANRLQKSIASMVPPKIVVKVVTTPEPMLSAWKGGSIFAAQSSYQDYCCLPHEFNTMEWTGNENHKSLIIKK